MVKSLIFLVVAVGLAAGYGIGNRVTPTTEKTLDKGRNNLKEKDELSPLAQPQEGLVEVKESEIPDGTLVYVLDELDLPQPEGETLKGADNLVFRPLFQYRNKQAALAQRRIANGYRRRYFIQRRPYRNAAYYYYNPYNSWY
ncbi:UNVERIFIED_CONTAM: hypothetical protein PYX00_000583 [Menopon gallinae]|uniref:Uncharacterized protein n=1 Tax=Menopon gallinae TaxID=328185 RepID=A0AAW2IAX7_9NEOP